MRLADLPQARKEVESLRSQAEDILLQADALEAAIDNVERENIGQTVIPGDFDSVDRRHEDNPPLYELRIPPRFQRGEAA